MTTLKQAAEKLQDWWPTPRTPSRDSIYAKLRELGLTTGAPLTMERAREILAKCEIAFGDGWHDQRHGEGNGTSDTPYTVGISTAAAKLVELLGPQPIRRITRTELLAAHDAAIAASHDEHGIQDRRDAIVGVLARRLGLEVADECKSKM